MLLLNVNYNLHNLNKNKEQHFCHYLTLILEVKKECQLKCPLKTLTLTFVAQKTQKMTSKTFHMTLIIQKITDVCYLT